MFRSINDKVRVRFLGEVYDGVITDEARNGAKIFYQVLIENGKNTCLWFNEKEVMDSYVYP